VSTTIPFGGILSFTIAAVAALASAAAGAQPYPSKPIELVVHTSAGSGGDVISRLVSEIARRDKILPQPFVVNNRVGGAAVIAYTYFKTQRGNPYSMLSITGTLLAMAHRPDTKIGLENYTPLALFAIDPQSIMVPADSPYKTFKELMDAARRSPDSLVAATTSVQGTGRMILYLLEKAVPGTKFKFVTFKGGGDAVVAAAGGHTQFTTENLSEGKALVDAKKLRVLAVSSDRRLPFAPDVPTLQELGYPVQAGTIRGFVFPAGVPREAATLMESALDKIHRSQTWKEHAASHLYQDVYMGSAEFSQFLVKRLAEYSEFYDAVGLGAQKP
jgi:tripartite-type tricarboxylate transporter receptor subunit TctC